MTQLDLFTASREPYKLARRDNPATSKQAASSVAIFAADHHAVILRALKDYGSKGLTVHEIAAYCRLDAHAIGKRVCELQEAGAIAVLQAEGDDVTRKTPSGRSARVWVLVG